MSERFLRRSLLYTPGSSMKMLEKAACCKADAVILDIEDSVSVNEKDSARENVKGMLNRLKKDGREVIVRINGMDSVWGYLDLMAIVPEAPDAVIVPKADEKALISANSFISALEREHKLAEGSIKMIPLFETTYSIANAFAVLGASGRIDGVQLGAEDLTKEQEIDRTAQGDEITFAREQLAFAARARKIDIIDTPYTGIKDISGLRDDAVRARNIGFTGKTCIHPAHIEVINEVFSPSEEAVIYARGVVEALEQGNREGRGAVMYMNKMVDLPIAERAQKTLAKAHRIEQMQKEN